MHGFGITKRIEQISRGVFRVNPGSLLVAFQRMERDGLIDAEWRATENNRRAKFYRITARGLKHFKAETKDWERRTTAVARLLDGAVVRRHGHRSSIRGGTSRAGQKVGQRARARRRGPTLSRDVRRREDARRHARTDAERAARIELGGIDSAKEGVRWIGWEAIVKSFWKDVHYALRRLAAHAGLYFRRRHVTRARHRSQHGDLQPRQRRAHSIVACARPAGLFYVRGARPVTSILHTLTSTTFAGTTPCSLGSPPGAESP